MLRWYQQEAVDAAWQYLCTQAGNPIIVAPTGSGKSHMVASLAETAVNQFRGRVIVLAHRKELLEQNAAKLGMDAGLYSAGLKRRDLDHDIIFAGIQSAYSRAHEFGERNLVIIDEVHLCPHDGEGMYRQFISDLRSANPTLRMVGLTATPYRLESGPICRPDSMFQNVCYSVDIKRMICEGFLCRLESRASKVAVNTKDIGIRKGEFIAREMQDSFSAVTAEACREIVRLTEGRHSVLVFCSGVEHAYSVARTIEELTGDDALAVTGETPPLEREATLEAFRTGRLRWLVNCDVLTTGFDAPCIDAIAVLRATMSPGLFAQMVGRGFRIHESKQDCLVLDFGNNIERHGPIDSPSYGVDRKSGQVEPGEAPTKLCPNCERVALIAARECECGFIFPEPDRGGVETGASDEAILCEPKTWIVEGVSARVWKKRSDPDAPRTMRVDYGCVPADGDGGDLEREDISEWVCVEHEGFAGSKAIKWWIARCSEPMPAEAEEAVRLFDLGIVARPRRITTVVDGRWLRIEGYELNEPLSLADVGGGGDEWDEEVPF